MRAALLLLFLVLPISVFAQQTTVEVFPLQHRLAAELVNVVTPLAAPDGVVRASGNNLIVRATPARMADIRKVIARLDTPPKQLLISVRQGSAVSNNGRSASIAGRVGNKHGRVVVPPSQREQGSVVVRDGNGNVIRGGASDFSGDDQHNSTQQIRVLAGRSAIIQIGQRVPVVQRQVYPSVGRPVVVEQQGYQDVTTGFRVLPRVHGQQFTLDISPQQASLGERGVINVQRLTTSVSGPLGEWVDIGGAVQQQSLSRSGLGSTSSIQSNTNNSVFIKVDESP